MTQEQTTERKVETGPLPELPSAPPGPSRRSRPGWWRWMVLGAVALLILAATLFALRPADPMADQRPVEVVRGFAAAIEARDATAMLAYVEPTVLKKQIGPEVRAYVEYIEEVRFSDARYELLANDGRRATVRWRATMDYRINYGEVRSGTAPVDATYALRWIEGTWYLSGVSLPQS